MARLALFWSHFRDNRAWGMPLWWSVRSAWAWSRGPSKALIEARKAYKRARNAGGQ